MLLLDYSRVKFKKERNYVVIVIRVCFLRCDEKKNNTDKIGECEVGHGLKGK